MVTEKFNYRYNVIFKQTLNVFIIVTNLLTYLLHGAQSFSRS
jgi:hypothetical protein